MDSDADILLSLYSGRHSRMEMFVEEWGNHLGSDSAPGRYVFVMVRLLKYKSLIIAVFLGKIVEGGEVVLS